MKRMLSVFLAMMLTAGLLTGCFGRDKNAGKDTNNGTNGVVTDDRGDADGAVTDESLAGGTPNNTTANDAAGGGMTNGAAPDGTADGDGLIGDMERGIGADLNGDGVTDDNVLDPKAK